MSNEKHMPMQRRERPEGSANRLTRRPARPKQDVEVIALEIDDEFDLGGDPYNHTGSHCVIRPRED